MMLLLMLAVAASVTYYVYSTTLLGKLEGANVPVTMDNLRIEAYNWNTQNLASLNVSIRNVGTDILTINTADWYVGGIPQTIVAGCAATLSPGAACVPQTLYFKVFKVIWPNFDNSEKDLCHVPIPKISEIAGRVPKAIGSG